MRVHTRTFQLLTIHTKNTATIAALPRRKHQVHNILHKKYTTTPIVITLVAYICSMSALCNTHDCSLYWYCYTWRRGNHQSCKFMSISCHFQDRKSASRLM